MNIYCIIIHFGLISATAKCINSIKALERSNYQIQYIVVDNNKRNLGYGGGANKGIKQALKDRNTEFVLLLNNDIVLDKGMLTPLLKETETNEKMITGPLNVIIKNDGTRVLSKGIIDRKRYTAGHLYVPEENTLETEEADFITGSAMLISRKVFDMIGYFDERYFMYYEDVDFCVRAKKKGIKCLFIPNSIVYHRESSSIDDRNKEYYMARNHLLFVEKHAPSRVKMRELLRLPKTVYEHTERYDSGGSEALIGIRDYFFRNFGLKTN